jgi:hypothetical protein
MTACRLLLDKAPYKETAMGWASRRPGRYGDLSGVEVRRQRRLRPFERLAGSGDAVANGAAGSMGEDSRRRTGADAIWLQA